MKIKRWLPALLILIILIGCTLGTVFAAEADCTPITPKADFMPDPRQPDVYVPPVYFGDDSENTKPAVFHATVEDAAVELRGLLENRVASIAIGFQTTSSDYDKRLEVFYEALEHTGVPTQGDYLAYQHGAFQYGYSGYSSGDTYYITFTYQMTYYTTVQQEAQMDTAVDALLDELNVYDASDYEKITAVYDYMCENITYDYDGLDIYKQDNTYTKIYTAYAALIDGTAVCQGYASLFYRLALELGVDTRLITGIGNGGGHAWNIVELDGFYYDVDATWDASWKQSGLDYEYYLRCDDDFGDHTRDAAFCTDAFNNAYPISKSNYLYTIDSGTCEKNTSWKLDSNYQLTISGTGFIESDPWSAYYYKIKSIVIEPGVTAVGDQVFSSFYELNTVTIPDSVATVGFAAFYACDSLETVIYGGTLDKWNSITLKNYNEDLTNATVLYTGEIKLKNVAPTLYDNIAMNYKADKARFDELGITNPYLVVSFNGNEATITDYVVNDDGQYVFTFYNIAPNQMADTLTATLYATYGNGVYEGATLDYSVATYCYRMLSNSAVVNNDAYAELRTLLVDLLHYGAMAQKFTGFTDETADALLTETQLAWGTTTTPTLESKTSTTYATITDPTASWKSVGLVLEDAVTMRFKFTVPSTEGVTLKITSDTNPEGWVIDSADFQYEESTGRYYVDFGGLHAGQMRESVYVTVYSGDTAISNTLRYTVESYAQKYQAADAATYPYLAELVKAMMVYGDAAYNFAN